LLETYHFITDIDIFIALNFSQFMPKSITDISEELLLFWQSKVTEIKIKIGETDLPDQG